LKIKDLGFALCLMFICDISGDVQSVWSSHLMAEALPADMKLPIPAVTPRTYTVPPGQQNTMEVSIITARPNR
jgi:hypothetical protein